MDARNEVFEAEDGVEETEQQGTEDEDEEEVNGEQMLPPSCGSNEGEFITLQCASGHEFPLSCEVWYLPDVLRIS